MTRTLFAKGGTPILVDDDDYEWLSQYRWYCVNGYAAAGQLKDGLSHRRMHRAILTRHGADLGNHQVDHADRNRMNNQKGNLRVATHVQNIRNARKSKRGVVRYKGVSPRTPKSWTARIAFDGKQVVLGHFPTEKEAARAYNEAARRHFGEFANLNEIVNDEDLDRLSNANANLQYKLDMTRKHLRLALKEIEQYKSLVSRMEKTIEELTARKDAA